MTSHVALLLGAEGLSPSPSHVLTARRRVYAAGRLATWHAFAVPGVLRVESIEYGEADMMAQGTVIAEVWLDGDGLEWRDRAAKIMAIEDGARQHGIRVVLAIHRATWRDRLGERWRWWTAGRWRE